MVVKKDPVQKMHNALGVPNLQVMKLDQSCRSFG